MTYRTYEHGGIYDKSYNIKYDFSVNVNPLGMPERVKNVLVENISLLEKYPNSEDCPFLTKISSKYNIPEDCFFIGNGASEVITLISQAILPRTAIVPVPTFSGYRKALSSRNCYVKEYELRSEDNFMLTEDFLTDVKREREADAIFLCNPNNPTGTLISREFIKKLADFCEDFGIYLVIDECFMGFVSNEKNASALSLVKDHPHLVVINALTKLYCLPGIRLGYCACSNKRIISDLNALKPEWNVSSYAMLAGETALSEDEYVKNSIDLISAEREFLTKELLDMGFTVFDSEANFLLTRLPLSILNSPSAITECNSFVDRLAKDSGILIRNCDNFSGLDSSYFRIAVRNHSENAELLHALKKYI
ncbi:MAG: aminotransferase class I/II-fold pyridoxal phosphate-dependent enzyme [Butyrivibrio sp.]|nr:aminotransferase class I/II-fold pyridoxal phosphate-dependent enzyme [Butyrivibrio sp.]